MGNVIIVGAILVVVALVAASYVRRLRSGGCNCGSHGGDSAPTRAVMVADTDESHYPCAADVPVEGMTCERCAVRVEDALNALPGTWARVDLTSGTAHVLSKHAIDRAACEEAVRSAGYSVPEA